MARIRSVSAARACAMRRAAVAVGAANGLTPLPQRYMRPGLPGSLTFVPAWRRESTTLMSSRPKSGTMPAATAASAKRP